MFHHRHCPLDDGQCAVFLFYEDGKNDSSCIEEWNVDPQMIANLKEQYKKERYRDSKPNLETPESMFLFILFEHQKLLILLVSYLAYIIDSDTHKFVIAICYCNFHKIGEQKQFKL